MTNKGKKLRSYSINKAKNIESDNFIRSDREKNNIAIAILEKWMIK